MAPTKATTAPYSKDERVLCFHHEMLYEAKILEVQQGDDAMYQYKIHYKGWKNTWDDWVPQDRIRKFNDENRELAAQLMQQARASLQKSSKPAKRAALKNGSDFSSARGSEERTGAAAVSGRGPRRARDYDMEHVSTEPPFCYVYCFDHYCLLLCIVLETSRMRSRDGNRKNPPVAWALRCQCRGVTWNFLNRFGHYCGQTFGWAASANWIYGYWVPKNPIVKN